MRAKEALDAARGAQMPSSATVAESLAAAYSDAKAKYEEKEKTLVAAGPGLMKTFWWLAGLLKTEPTLMLFAFVWTLLEALPVLVHAHAGTNAYERALFASLLTSGEQLRQRHAVHAARIVADAERKAALIAARRRAKQVIRDARTSRT